MNEENLTPLQKAFYLLEETEKKLEQYEKESFAVIGLSCRFPGGANDPKTFWELLKKGFNGISPIPKERWDSDKYYDPNRETPGKMYVRSGGFLHVPIDQFDTEFFGISPREAKYMDPQQRLLLEVTWEALENGGINPKSLEGSQTGVFVGVMMHDYNDLLLKKETDKEIDAYQTTGSIATCVLPGRISYFFGLEGPSFPVDTACSSSLVALNSACQSLRMGESSLALVGGVNLILAPEPNIAMCKASMLSPDGFCKTFDASADGYARGEGCGVLVLKRLSDAKKDGDTIFAVIKATGVNQDGASSGLTVPNGKAQENLMKSVWSKAGIEGSEIDYFEAHGTGTSLGDPIEIHAIETAMEGKRTNPLLISSVKTNFGHLESAAGIAGLIKIILALQGEAIPPHLHLKTLNPNIDLEKIPAKIPLELTPWPKGEKTRIAAISSYGIGGTNAHALVEEAPPLTESKVLLKDRPWQILTLSALTEKALQEMIENFSQLDLQLSLADVAFTANTGRATFPFRTAVVGNNLKDVLENLKTQKFAKVPDKPPKVAFVFPKNPNISFRSELYESEPVFKEAWDLCKVNEIFAFEYALTKLWKSWGIQPDYVLGYGEGKFVAAHIAGILTLDDALKLAAASSGDRSKVASTIQMQAPQLEMLSSQTGQILERKDLSQNYWTEEDGENIAVQSGLVLEMNLKEPLWKSVVEQLAQFYLQGLSINWKNFDSPYQRKKVLLPTYPFQRESFWAKPLTEKKVIKTFDGHPFLGEQIATPLSEKLFVNQLEPENFPFLKDHQVFEATLFPGTGFLEIMVAAGQALFEKKEVQIENFSIDQPLKIQNSPLSLRLIAKPDGENYQATIYSEKEKNWIVHATGTLSRIQKRDLVELSPLPEKEIGIQQFYQKLQELGFNYGKFFQPIQKVFVGEKELFAELQSSLQLNLECDPTLLDGSLHAIFALIGFEDPNHVYLPIAIGRFALFENLEPTIQMQGEIVKKGADLFTFNVEIFSKKGNHLASIREVQVRKTTRDTLKKITEKQDMPHIFYEMNWIPQIGNPQKLEGNWLILSEGGTLTQTLTALMKKGNIKFTILEKKEETHIQKTLQNETYKGIIYLWPLESSEDSLKSALTLIQTIQKLDLSLRICFVTQGSTPLADSPIFLPQTSIPGFYRTLKLEMPSLFTQLVDLDPEKSMEENGKDLFAELSTNSPDDSVTYRKGIRLVPRMRDAVLTNQKLLHIDPQGSYLITGGLTGLGLKCAEWLADKGAKHLLLLGRKAPSEGALEKIKSLEKRGVRLETHSIDIADKERVKDLFQNFGKKWPPLKGIIHSAGVIDDAPIQLQSWARFEKVLSPKIQGSMNLYEALQSNPVDFFVLFSSISSPFGNPGQSNYSSANAFLDSFAFWCRQKSIPAISLSWGPWAEIGAAAHLTKRHEASGFIPIKPEEGMAALEQALNLKKSHLIVAKIDWKTFFSKFTSRNLPWLQNFAPKEEKEEAISEVLLTTKLKDVSPNERKEIIQETVRNLVQSILQMNKALSDDQGFFDSGMDSIMAVELRNKLQVELGKNIKLPASLAFDQPTIKELSKFIENLLYPPKEKVTEPRDEIAILVESKKEKLEHAVKEMSLNDIKKLLD